MIASGVRSSWEALLISAVQRRAPPDRASTGIEGVGEFTELVSAAV